MKDIIYKDIAESTQKSESAIKQWKKNNPELLEIATIGTFCRKNNLDIDKIKKLVEIQEMVKNSG